TAFSIWEEGQVIGRWANHNPVEPNYLPQTTDEVLVPIQLHGQEFGKLKVDGLCKPNVINRLVAEAEFIAELVKLEEDLESMTAELVSAQDQLLALYNLTQVTRTSLNLDEVLGPFIEELTSLVKAEGAFITLNSSSQPILVEQCPQTFFDQSTLQKFFIETKKANQELLLPADSELLHSLSVSIRQSFLFLKTITIRHTTTVMLGLLLNQPAAALSPYLKLARAMSDYAGAQLENVLLYQETLDKAKLKTELELAARIQLQLLPRTPPHIDDLDIAAESRPALDVGGDFFDFITQQGSGFTFVLGDVSGKGTAAALLMAMVRTIVRSEAKLLPPPTPEDILGKANDHLYDDFTDVGMFATLFIGNYHPTDHQIVYTNAGHAPVIHCPLDGEPYLLEADGPPMGMLPTSLSENKLITFNPGDVLVVATDGFNEARNPADEMFGYHQLMALIKGIAHKSAGEISKILFETVHEFSESCPQDDDQTLIVIKQATT
ncbi:MAG: PP2C family protein-serine/threonine phosphatase, partial [Anaerolineae bacterium]|nr:PP2C family protein-serine/threonine phosphatase [Anaerolineae bacterium]